jgi:bifunctional DNA-binding transcriptional regulator/antitoxin component of YhaV-PrlF toxin-antitoxin module
MRKARIAKRYQVTVPRSITSSTNWNVGDAKYASIVEGVISLENGEGTSGQPIKLRPRNQITLPAEICRELGISELDFVEFDVRDGRAIIVPRVVTTSGLLRQLPGDTPTPSRRLPSFDALDELKDLARHRRAGRSQRSVGFLLGAGVSIPCGAPSTAILTAELLGDAIPYFRATDERYYPIGADGRTHPHPHGVPTIEHVSALLRRLKRYVDEYYSNRCDPPGCVQRQVNYEDLAYLAVQISETIVRDRDNPALLPFVEEIADEFEIDAGALRELADEAIGLINDHIFHRLNCLTPAADHLGSIVDGARLDVDRELPIISLNHDCLIEAALIRAGIRFGDFTLPTPDGRRVLEGVPYPKGPTLYKLHGSIDWYRWQPLKADASTLRWDEWIGALPGGNSGSSWRADDRPLILVGRFNKELSYASPPFSRLFWSASESLERTSCLVVSGYSFGDKAVNGMVIDWIYGAPPGARRLLLAHPDPESVKRGARGAIASQWDSWLEAGALRTVSAYLGALTWSDIERELH